MLSTVNVGSKTLWKSPICSSKNLCQRICHLHARAVFHTRKNHLGALTSLNSASKKRGGHLLSFRSLTDESSKRPRPFRVLGLQQIAIGSLQKSSLSDLWGDLLGLERVGSYKSEEENVDEDIYVLGKEGSPFAIEVDLMAPLDAGRSPKVHKPALNHVGLWVDDLQAAVNWLSKDKEVRFAPGGIRKGASGHDVAFIHPLGNDTHPKSGCGVLIELVQAPESIIRAWDL
eukprot:CAMPEP_0116028206 /NCGR_PEP_ID=MMETSP0321-20121206/15239_1 /TAXON_ID=163516 /ORGANISM="Leptocylindrus danicus var. danicus, Strain B650" /LENGTH=229 /DNA_ID=CAMNT_0003502013 /DNA_START=26 /DNA_END=715 /DNA_ORIENTATION=+